MLSVGGFVDRCFRDMNNIVRWGKGGGCFETWVLFKNLASVADVLSGIVASQIQMHIMIHKLIHIFHAYW